LIPYHKKILNESLVIFDDFEYFSLNEIEQNRLFLIMLIAANAIITYLWEIFFDFILKKYNKKYDE